MTMIPGAAAFGLRTCLAMLGLMNLPAQAQHAPPPLPPLALDAQGVSVSGLSSGGYMAAQFQIAYSRSLAGAGIVAGGPYGCSMGSVSTAALTCSCPYDIADASGPLGLNNAVSRLGCTRLPEQVLADRAARAVQNNKGHIDGIGNLRKHRVWLYSGEDDPVVDPLIVKGLARFYRDAKVMSVEQVSGPHAGHGMPIAEDGQCQVTRSPYINGCKIDGAGQLLSWIYKLPAGLPPAEAQAGSLKPFDQTPYRQGGVFDGMDQTGWVYVPKACEQASSRCKLHVVFHGCEQGQNFVMADGQPYGTVFVEQSGYNRWAERANIVVLYPQVVPKQQLNPGSAFGYNPKGCWDFWGYTTPPTDQWQFGSGLPFNRREAPQMRAVKAMIDALLAAPQRNVGSFDLELHTR